MSQRKSVPDGTKKDEKALYRRFRKTYRKYHTANPLIRLKRSLHDFFKDLAAQDGRKLRDLVEDACLEYLEKRAREAIRGKVEVYQMQTPPRKAKPGDVPFNPPVLPVSGDKGQD